MAVKDYFGLIFHDIRDMAAGRRYNITETVAGHYMNAYHSIYHPAGMQVLGTKFNYAEFGKFIGLYREVWCQAPYDIILPGQSPVIVDAGANIGLSTLRLARLNPGATFHCFEPQPDLYALLEKNITANKVKATTYNVALSDKPGNMPFYVDSTKKDAASLFNYAASTSEIMVPAVCLSSYIRPLDKVDLLKIDIEGGEVKVLNDLIQTGEIAKIKHIIMEFHEVGGLTLKDFISMLTGAGFKIQKIYNLCATVEMGLICNLNAIK